MFGKIAQCSGKQVSDECLEAETRIECAVLAGGGTLATLLLYHGLFACSSMYNATLTTSTTILTTSLGDRLGDAIYRMASGWSQNSGERQRILERTNNETQTSETGQTLGQL